MDPENASPTASQMIDAFVHPPTLLVVNKRIDGERVIVLSHIELWPWQTVVCGVIANRRFTPPDPPSPRGHVDSSIAGGIVTAQLVARSDEARAALRQSIEWMSAWTLTDDANTAYELDGWNGPPTSEQLWSDVAWRYRTPAPPEARVVSFTGPGLMPIAVRRSA